MSGYYQARYVRLRRKRRKFPIFLLAALIAAFIAFDRVGRPLIASIDMAAQIESEERVTQDATLPGIVSYMIELTRAADQVSSRIEAARYVSRGAAGYVWETDNGYSILGAAYQTEAQARQVAQKLLAEEGIEAGVRKVSGPEMRLRVTATPTQLAALTNGCARFLETVDTLDRYAFALDGQTAREKDVRQALLHDRDSVLASRDALARAAGETPNAIAGSFLTLLTALADAQRNLCDAEFDSPLSFSGNIKYNSIALRMRYASFLNGEAIAQPAPFQ